MAAWWHVDLKVLSESTLVSVQEFKIPRVAKTFDVTTLLGRENLDMLRMTFEDVGAAAHNEVHLINELFSETAMGELSAHDYVTTVNYGRVVLEAYLRDLNVLVTMLTWFKQARHGKTSPLYMADGVEKGRGPAEVYRMARAIIGLGDVIRTVIRARAHDPINHLNDDVLAYIRPHGRPRALAALLGLNVATVTIEERFNVVYGFCAAIAELQEAAMARGGLQSLKKFLDGKDVDSISRSRTNWGGSVDTRIDSGMFGTGWYARLGLTHLQAVMLTADITTALQGAYGASAGWVCSCGETSKVFGVFSCRLPRVRTLSSDDYRLVSDRPPFVVLACHKVSPKRKSFDQQGQTPHGGPTLMNLHGVLSTYLVTFMTVRDADALAGTCHLASYADQRRYGTREELERAVVRGARRVPDGIALYGYYDRVLVHNLPSREVLHRNVDPGTPQIAPSLLVPSAHHEYQN